MLMEAIRKNLNQRMLSRNFIMNKVIEKKLSWRKILVDKSAI